MVFDTINMRVVDTSNIMFDILVPVNLIPKTVKAGQVARITKVVKSKDG